MSELKPCPFCGANGKIIKLNHKGANGEYKTLIKCERCGCRTYTEYPLPHDSYLTRLERVVSLWNTRTDPEKDRLQQENAKLREMVRLAVEDMSGICYLCSNATLYKIGSPTTMTCKYLRVGVLATNRQPKCLHFLWRGVHADKLKELGVEV